MHWEDALGLVFYSGLIFLLLTISGIRQKLIEAIPADFKTAITCGIGLFIAFVGLKNAGIILGSSATFVQIGNIDTAQTLLALLGIIGITLCIARGVPGAVILNILAITIIDLALQFTGVIKSNTPLPTHLIGLPASLSPILFHLHLSFMWMSWNNLLFALPLILSILFVDLFDNMGTLIGVCKRANLLDENGNLPKIGKAFAADAGAAIIGSCLGTSTVTSYIESAAGVEAGARTGLASFVTAACFLMALFFSPLISIIPDAATAPALIVIGILMFQSAAQLDLSNLIRAVPLTLCIILMPLTFSISEGIAMGLLLDLILRIGMGQFTKIAPLEYLLGILFAIHYFVPK
jgi:AGZA family xanthine/uracil permease-like MFS transporter